jgi:Mannosyltransferase (PIG-V)
VIASLRARWRTGSPPWVEGALIGLASRLFSVAVLAVAYLANQPRVAAYWPTPFEMWDGFWYGSITRFGYHADAVVPTLVGHGFHDFAFFPAWPLLVRVASLNGLLPAEVVAPVLANALFVVAAALIFRVMVEISGRPTARVGLALFAFSPAGYVYSLDYAEPLFLVAAAAYFLTRTPARTAAAAALATISRLGGLALAAAALADLPNPETRRRGVATILAVALTFAAWWIFIAILTGDPLGYMQGSPAWFSVNPVPTQTGLAGILGREQPGGILTGVYLLLLGIGAARLLRGGRLGLGLFSAACIVSALLVNWSTMARLASIAFPAFVAIADLSANRWYRPALFGGFVAAQVASIFLAELHLITP